MDETHGDQVRGRKAVGITRIAHCIGLAFPSCGAEHFNFKSALGERVGDVVRPAKSSAEFGNDFVRERFCSFIGGQIRRDTDNGLFGFSANLLGNRFGLLPVSASDDDRSAFSGKFLRDGFADSRRTPQLTCRGRLQHLDAAQNQDGGPGQVQRLVRRDSTKQRPSNTRERLVKRTHLRVVPEVIAERADKKLDVARVPRRDEVAINDDSVVLPNTAAPDHHRFDG